MRIVNQGIQTGLSNSPYHLEFYSEYLDPGLFPDPAVQQEFRDFYIRKYQNRQPDVIITVGPTPLKFMQEAHQRAFPGIPIIFCLPTGDVPSASALGSGFTGVESDMAPAETVQTALKLQPGTRHVVVLGGVSARDKHEQALLKQQIKGLTDHLEITYMTDVAVPQLPEHLKHLPPHTLVLLLSYSNDVAGTEYKSNEIGSLVAAAANAPVFTFYDVYLNHGEVGGYLSNFDEQGKLAGAMALKILQGEKPQDIPRVKGVNTYMFDWRAVKRWGLIESEIPPGSIILNRQPTVWESYRGYIIGGTSLILLEALLIGELLWQRTRRRKVESDLVVTNDRLRMALEAGKSVGWEWDVRSGRDQWFGDLQTMFGIPVDNYSGRPDDFYRFVYPEDRERVAKAVADARKSRNPYMAEFRIVRTDETVRWVTARGTFYYAKNGDAERMLGMAVDITDRKRAEQELHASEDRLAGIVGSAMDGIIAVDEEQRIVLFNAAAEKMLDCTQDEAIGTVIDRFIPERFRSRHEAYMRRFAESGVTTRTMEAPAGLWALRSNGQEFPVEASITHLESEGKNLFTVTIRDITERRRAEEAVRESEERFRLVANTAPVMIWMSGTDRLSNYFNKTWLDFTGRPLAAELGDGWSEGVHPEDLKACLDTYTKAFDRRRSFTMQYRLRRHDGEYRWLLEIGVPRSNPDGSFDGFIGSCLDVTERKLAEEALRESEARFQDLAEQSRTTHWEVDPKGLFLYVSDVTQVSWGYRPDEVMRRMHFYDIHPNEGREEFKAAAFAAMERKQPFQDFVHAIETKDGRIAWSSANGIPLLNADGTLRGYRGTCTDVTERKLADDALASMGRRLIEAHEEERTWIARELHDDFNQRIAMLTIDLERWGKQLPDSAIEFHDHISHVRERLLDMARDVQGLSHRLHSSKLEYLGIVAAAKGFCRELSEQKKVEIDFSHTNIPDGVPKEISLCLFRVLQEALQNAVKHSGVRQFAVELNGMEQEIQLTVSDQGVGFDPRAAIDSHGLGLISMRERLHLAAGQISIESQPGSGTTIHARVPFSSRSNFADADPITSAVSRTS